MDQNEFAEKHIKIITLHMENEWLSKYDSIEIIGQQTKLQKKSGAVLTQFVMN